MNRWCVRWSVLATILALLSVTGCGGCRSNEAETQPETGEQAAPVVVISEPVPLPYGNEVFRMLVKPGHVAEAQQEFKTGPIDINGRIEGQSFSKTGQALPVPGSRWSLNFTRDISLPNRQTKRFDLRFFISPSLERDENSLVPTNPDLRTVLIDRSNGTPVVAPRPTPTTPIPGHQYFFVVLSDRLDDYSFLAKSDIVSWASLEVWDGELQAAYQLILCSRQGDRWMIPSTFFGWTTTSFLLWDDVDPNSLSTSQKQALIDWLHWGGQLIISGPTSISRLTGSFLEPYLPLHSINTTAFDQAKLDFLNQTWALREPQSSRLMPKATLLPEDEPKSTEDDNGPLPFNMGTGFEATSENFEPITPKSDDVLDVLGPLPQRSLALLQGELHPESTWLENTGNLVAERRVGRGRVVLSTISISEPFFARWRSFPSFINGALLGRPPRAWQENSFNSRQTWLYTPDQEADSRLATHFRITTRDALASNINEPILFEPTRSKAQEPLRWDNVDTHGSVISGWDGDPINGIGAWNSSSSASNAAKAYLRDAAGINVPKIGTILAILIGYLVCLVPINWFLFFMLGKVEWSWAAVPVISIGGVITVAYIAQLDIGFARSYTEVAVVEAFPDHPRAHTTRYSAIYSSLSTPYKLTLDSDSGLTVPMISREREVSSALVESVRFDYGSADGNFLYPLNILSNSTTFLHTEQMIDLGGTFQFAYHDDSQSNFTLENNTRYSWESVAAIRRNSEGQLEAGWIDELPSGSRSTAEFSTAALTALANHWNWRSSTSNNDGPSSAAVEFSTLMRAISGLSFMRAGEIKVLAFLPDGVEGLKVEPYTGSILRNTALVLNIQSGQYPTPEPDRSLPSRQMKLESEKRDADESNEKESLSITPNVSPSSTTDTEPPKP